MQWGEMYEGEMFEVEVIELVTGKDWKIDVESSTSKIFGEMNSSN